MIIPKDVFLAAVDESPVLRGWASELLWKTVSEPVVNSVKDEVRAALSQLNPDHKIVLIKKLRELSRGRMSEFSIAYPEFNRSKLDTSIGIADAKKMIESWYP